MVWALPWRLCEEVLDRASHEEKMLGGPWGILRGRVSAFELLPERPQGLQLTDLNASWAKLVWNLIADP